MLLRALLPRGLWRQNARYFGRGDILAELLDEMSFAGKTYADVPHQRPFVTVNATDMQYGGRFEFTQDQFDHICSDLDRLPISRAVAASMAAPLVFSPPSSLPGRHLAEDFWRAGVRWFATTATSIDLSHSDGTGSTALRWWTLGVNWVFDR